MNDAQTARALETLSGIVNSLAQQVASHHFELLHRLDNQDAADADIRTLLSNTQADVAALVAAANEKSSIEDLARRLQERAQNG